MLALLELMRRVLLLEVGDGAPRGIEICAASASDERERAGVPAWSVLTVCLSAVTSGEAPSLAATAGVAAGVAMARHGSLVVLIFTPYHLRMLSAAGGGLPRGGGVAHTLQTLLPQLDAAGAA